jgi:hypothetical protein
MMEQLHVLQIGRFRRRTFREASARIGRLPHSFIKQDAANAAHKALRLEQVKIRALRAPNHQEFWRKLSS